MPKRKSNTIRASVEALQELLIDVCRRPLEYRDDQEFVASLKSQGRLYASYSNDHYAIKPSSINTVKKVSAEIIPGGFSELDNLRLAAKTRIEETRVVEEKGNKRTKAGLKALLEKREREIEALRHANFLLLQAVSEARRDIDAVAGIEGIEIRKERSRQAVMKLAAILTLSPAPFHEPLSETNVEPLRPVR